MYDKLVKSLREDHGKQYFARDMEAADAIEEISTNYDAATDIMKHQTEYIEELERERDSANDAATALYGALPKWIPVTERLPEEKKAHYLCLLDDDSMAVVYWSKVPDWTSKGEWTWHNPNWKEVTHWMPLPQPPKEE